MSDAVLARHLCKRVCKHYGLSKAATRAALDAATLSPGRAITCYGAILDSLVKP